MFGTGSANLSSSLSVGHLKWTHGALDRNDTLGFLMSDVPGFRLEGAVRSFDALRPLRAVLISRGVLDPAATVSLNTVPPANR